LCKIILFGKFINAGQTCIAPDYVLVHESIKQKFIDTIKQRLIKLYGEDASLSPDFGRIVNDRYFDRLINLLDQEKVIVGGKYSKLDRYIAPIIMENVTLDDNVMKEEIFGPILPVIEYKI